MTRIQISCAYLVISMSFGAACQRMALPITRHQSNQRTVLVEGEMRYPGIASPLQGFEAVFMRKLQAPISEQIITTEMPGTGRYKVRLEAV